jgi:hypothetical protein
MGHVAISADGRRIAFLGGHSKVELLVIRNLLPRARTLMEVGRTNDEVRMESGVVIRPSFRLRSSYWNPDAHSTYSALHHNYSWLALATFNHSTAEVDRRCAGGVCAGTPGCWATGSERVGCVPGTAAKRILERRLGLCNESAIRQGQVGIFVLGVDGFEQGPRETGRATGGLLAYGRHNAQALYADLFPSISRALATI